MAQLTRAEDSSKWKLKRPRRSRSEFLHSANRPCVCLRGKRLGVACPYLTFPWHGCNTILRCALQLVPSSEREHQGTFQGPCLPHWGFAPHQGEQMSPQCCLQSPIDMVLYSPQSRVAAREVQRL